VSFPVTFTVTRATGGGGSGGGGGGIGSGVGAGGPALSGGNSGGADTVIPGGLNDPVLNGGGDAPVQNNPGENSNNNPPLNDSGVVPDADNGAVIADSGGLAPANTAPAASTVSTASQSSSRRPAAAAGGGGGNTSAPSSGGSGLAGGIVGSPETGGPGPDTIFTDPQPSPVMVGGGGDALTPAPSSAIDESPSSARADTDVKSLSAAQLQRQETLCALKGMDVRLMGIGSLEVPIFGPSGSATWSFLNLLLALVCLVAAGVSARSARMDFRNIRLAMGQFLTLGTKRERVAARETEKRLRTRARWKILSVIVGLFAIVLFFVTKDLRDLMVVADSFTWPMAIVTVLQMLVLHTAFRGRSPDMNSDGVRVGGRK
jgi:hypothetical protein